MTERLDRIEVAVERNSANIHILTDAFQSVSQRMSQMLEIMQQTEGERQAMQSRMDHMLEVMMSNQRKITANEDRFETLLAEGRADRMEWQRQMAAQNEAIQALLVQMASNNARIDRLEEG